MPEEHKEIGDKPADSSAIEHLRQLESAFAKMLGYMERDDARTQAAQDYIDSLRAHNIKVGAQYYWLRWIGGIVILFTPLAVLCYVVLWLTTGGAFDESHATVQGILVSGSFISVAVLCGIFLNGMFRPLKDKPTHDEKQPHPHNDVDVPPENKMSDSLPDGYKETLNQMGETFKNMSRGTDDK